MLDVVINRDQVSLSEDNAPSNLLLVNNRLGECEVCGEVTAKYTCPACDVKTCSLPCVHIHKKELNCTGIRNKVKFKPIHHFTDMDLQSDYRLLEEMGRSVESVVRARRPFQKNQAFKWQKLKNQLQDRGTYLYFLPPRFSKHINNTSFLNWNTGVIYWKIELLFPQASSQTYSITESRVDETSLISDLLEKYLSPDSNLKRELNDRLQPYLEVGTQGVKVLIKAEKTPGPTKYMMMTTTRSLAENLQGKVIIEHPSLHIVLNTFIQQYHIVSPESIEVNHVRDERPRRPGKGVKRKSLTNSSIKFFSDDICDSD